MGKAGFQISRPPADCSAGDVNAVGSFIGCNQFFDRDTPADADVKDIISFSPVIQSCQVGSNQVKYVNIISFGCAVFCIIVIAEDQQFLDLARSYMVENGNYVFCRLFRIFSEAGYISNRIEVSQNSDTELSCCPGYGLKHPFADDLAFTIGIGRFHDRLIFFKGCRIALIDGGAGAEDEFLHLML